MENPKERKRFPWAWVVGGCGVLTVLGLIGVAVAILLALPTMRTTTIIQVPPSNPLQVPRSGATAVPNTTPGNGTTVGNLPFKFSAVQDPTTLPNQSLMDQMTTTLKLNSDSDFMAPKNYKGTITLDPSTGFTLGNAWCAKDSATLQQNMVNMQFQLSINGTTIDLSQYPKLTFSDNQGNACAMTGVAITVNGNLSGTYHFVLTQKYLSQLDDGITGSPYPAGDVIFDFNIQFKVVPGSGKNT